MVEVKEFETNVLNCLQYLAARCDGAQDKDGKGFSGADAEFGKSLSEQDELSTAQAVIAARMVRKYRKQLAKGGLTPPEVEDDEAFQEERKKEATQKAKERQASKAPARPQSNGEQRRNRIYIAKKRIVVEFDYDPQLVAAVKPLKEKIKDWMFDRLLGRKEWSYPQEEIATVLQAISPYADRLEIDPEIAQVQAQIEHEQEIARQIAELERRQRELEIAAALANVRPELEGEPLPCGKKLYQHQKDAVRQMIQQGRTILAHKMGLGKTMEALVAAKAYNMPVIVVAPAGLKINWLREAEDVGVPIEFWSWAKIPQMPDDMDYVLIGDESHYAQNIKSKRTQSFLKLAEHARAVILASGTPMKNGRPSNLYPLLKACNHPIAADQRAFEMRYCNASVLEKGHNRFWDTTGATHLDELYEKTKTIILYKEKKDCMDLPAKTRIMRQAEISKETRTEYEQLLSTLRKKHQENKALSIEARIKKMREELGEDFEEEEARSLVESGAGEGDALVELGILRHAASMAKMESAIALAEEVMEQDESIVLFTAFKDSAAHLARHFGCAVITGDVKPADRQQIVDDFQARKTKVVVCTHGAGGVGITLTAAQTIVLVDRPWTPGDAEQAEDRIHRIGQTGNVTAIWLQHGDIDVMIDTLLQKKQDRINKVLRGERKTMRGIKSIKDLAKEIMSAIHSGQSLDELLKISEAEDNQAEAVEERPEQDTTKTAAPPVAEIQTAESTPEHQAKQEKSQSTTPAVETAAIQVAHIQEAEPAAPPVAEIQKTEHQAEQERTAPAVETGQKEPTTVSEAILARKRQPKQASVGPAWKGKEKRMRKMTSLNAKVFEFLESLKATPDKAQVDGGGSAFIDYAIMKTEEFQAWIKQQPKEEE